MHPSDKVANARALVKLLLDMLAEANGLMLSPEGALGLFLVLQAVADELTEAQEALEKNQIAA